LKDVSLLKKLILIVGGSFLIALARIILRRPFTLPLLFFWFTFVAMIVILDLTIGRWMRAKPPSRSMVLSIGAALILLTAIVWIVSIFFGYPLSARATIAIAFMIVIGLLFWWSRKDRNKGVPKQLR